jgi:hypothetical protein
MEDVLAGVYFIATEKHAAGAMGVRAGDYLRWSARYQLFFSLQ